MTWFVNQVINLFTWGFNLLNSIEFWGTSLLKILITIVIIGAILPVLLTIGKTTAEIGEHNLAVKEKNKNQYKKAERKW